MRLILTYVRPPLLQLLLMLLVAKYTVYADETYYSIPTIDDSVAGQIGFAGHYAGISNIKNSLQYESYSNNKTVLIQQTNEIVELLATFDGNITSSCLFRDHIYFGGHFKTVNQTITANHIIVYDTQTNQFQTLNNGLDGPVYALYCDVVSNIVYVGGNFTSPINTITNANNVASYNTNNNTWLPLPWKGFNGPIYTITKNEKYNTMLFGGRFDSIGDGQFLNSNTSQSIAMSSPTTISSGNGALSGEYSNPSNIICPNKLSPEAIGKPWYIQDGVPGYWDANFANPVEPTVFRLSNTHTDRGAISFNILALGSNENFNLSYIDPDTQQMIACSTSCILSNSTYQDFTVVDTISTTGIRIFIDSWYGSGGGLGFVQIYQADISVHPNLDSMNNQCNPSSSSTQTTVNGSWKNVYVYGYYQVVLEAQVAYSELATTGTSIVYEPNIPAQGQYDIYATTPGCVGSSNCFERTQVQYILDLSPGFPATVVFSDQNTFSDQRTLIYSGFISPVSDKFRPSITLKPAINASESGNGGEYVTIMADTIEFVRNKAGSSLSSILEYNPAIENNASPNGSLSSLSWKPLNQQLSPGSTVYTIDASSGDTLYIGGSFSGLSNSACRYKNIAQYNVAEGKLTSVNEDVPSGLNGAVLTLKLHNSRLYVGGEFNSTALSRPISSNIVQLDTVQNNWTNIGNGVDGRVNNIILSSTNLSITISGAFNNKIVSLNVSKVSVGNAVWDIVDQTWMERSSLVVGEIATDHYISPDHNTRLFSGAITGSQAYRADLVISSNLNSSRSIFNSSMIITAGVTWLNNLTGPTDTPVTIIGGYLDNYPSMSILTIFDNSTKKWNNIDFYLGRIHSLAVFDNKLYVGGQFPAWPARNQSSSLAIYDLANKNANVKTQGVQDEHGNPGIVNVIKIHPDGKHVLIGGEFSRVGLFDCEAVCVVDPRIQQWNTFALGLSGTVTDMVTYPGNNNDQKVTVVGNLVVQNQPSIAIASILLSQTTTWSIDLTADKLIGTPHTAASSVDNELIIAGFSSSDPTDFFVGTLSGKSYTSLNTNLGKGTNISQILLVPMSSSPDQKNYPGGTANMLLAVGHINVTDFGNTSAALYDGSVWHPYLLTTQIDGKPGSIQIVIHTTDFNGIIPGRRFLSVAAVILISIAISIGVLFALSAATLLFLFFQRRKAIGPEEASTWLPANRFLDTFGLFGTGSLGRDAIAATAVTGFGSDAAIAATAGISSSRVGPSNPPISRSVYHHNDDEDISIYPYSSSVINNPIPITAAAAAAGILSFETMVATAKLNKLNAAAISETNPKLFTAKYSFQAQEFGELNLNEGDAVVVTDTSDSVWWLGYKDGGSGNPPVSGVFPSNYVKQ